MSIIRILPDEIANRIAAGEVIERPASVVKELVENSIDAGARRIVIHARQGGRSLIQVMDDGSGMDRDDALLCLEPHATSKIREPGDIEHITTLGFRGEALPSIASVSRFQLQTRRPEELSGFEVNVEGGALRDCRECGCAPGTSIRVHQLFFNLPGRRKFLKGAATESEHIQETVLLQALAHPGTAFELLLDEQPALQVSAATDPGARVAMLLGRDVYAAMIPVDYEENGIRITGFVARPGLTRSSRREQRFFVNGRPAMSDSMYFGVRDAYHTLVMKGRYPPLVLYVEIAPDRVDVNVHPAKREVRFREDALVGQITSAAVRRALRGLAGMPAAGAGTGVTVGQYDGRPVEPVDSSAAGASTATPPHRHTTTPVSRNRPPEQVPLPFPAPASFENRRPPPAARAEPVPYFTRPAAGVDKVDGMDNVDGTAPAAPTAPPAGFSTATPPHRHTVTPASSGTSPSSATRAEIRSLRVLGVLSTLYLVAEGAGGLVVVDQHAAHERILFERLLRMAESNAPESQPLLMPSSVELSPADAALLRRNLEHFNRLGFGLDTFGGNAFLVTAVPVRFPHENLAGLLRDILDDLRQAAAGTPRPDEVRIAQAACKHAVKENDPLDSTEIAKLLADLAECEMPYTCPHGRPTMITVPHGEIERRFGRRV